MVLPFDATVDVHPPAPLATLDGGPNGLVSKRKADQLVAAVEENGPLTLYLVPRLAKLTTGWARTAGRVAARYLDAERLAADGPTAAADFVDAVVLRGADPASVRAALMPAAVAVRDNRRVEVKAEQRWKEFLLGRSPFAAARGTAVATPHSGTIRVGLLTAVGLVDPSSLFEAAIAEDAVEPPDRPAIEALLATMGRTPPAVDPATPPDQVDGRRLLWADLMAWRAARRPTCAEWRAVLDRQKARLLTELAERLEPSGTGRRFVFHEHDVRSPVQIEAITEFYLNNPDPRGSPDPLVTPGAEGYRAVELSDLFGWAAQDQSGTTVALDGDPALDRVVPGRAVLELDGAGRDGHQFRIMRVHGTSVELDEPAALAGPSSWRILQDPDLVLLDAAGARVTGADATATGPAEVTLIGLGPSQLAGVQRINRFYDTIGFKDTPAGSRSDFRVVDVQIVTAPGRPPDAVLSLDGTPNLTGGAGWAVPAGLGGRLAPVPWPRAAQSSAKSWYDHYDGRLFVVTGDRVAAVLPWTSLTSRAQPVAYQSSLAGNRHYRAFSALTPKHHTTFKVVDAGALPHGASAAATGASAITLDAPAALADYHKQNGWWLHLLSPAPRRSRAIPLAVSTDEQTADLARSRVHVGGANRGARPTTPTPYWLELYDGVRHAAQYFDADVVPDVATPGPPTPKAKPGKFGIRMHVGGIVGTGSQGCLVSPWFWSFRNTMTSLHERRHRTFYAENDHADLIADVNTTTMDPPPVVARFDKASDRLDQLTAQLTRIEDVVLRPAAQEAAEGGDELVLLAERLTTVLAEMRARRTVDAEHGDDVEADRFQDLLDEVSEMIIDDDYTAPLDEVQDPVLATQLAAVVALRAEIAEAAETLRAEEIRVGWTRALRSDLYVIRPEERPLP